LTALPLAQLDPADLAGEGLGKIGHELDQPRIRVRRVVVTDERLDLIRQLFGRRMSSARTTNALTT
jgi:hypothetical protein